MGLFYAIPTDRARMLLCMGSPLTKCIPRTEQRKGCQNLILQTITTIITIHKIGRDVSCFTVSVTVVSQNTNRASINCTFWKARWAERESYLGSFANRPHTLKCLRSCNHAALRGGWNKQLRWYSVRLMIRLPVRILPKASGEFSSPELTFCADSCLVSIPPLCYCKWHI